MYKSITTTTTRQYFKVSLTFQMFWYNMVSHWYQQQHMSWKKYNIIKYKMRLLPRYISKKFVLMLRPFIPELVMYTDLLSFEHPSVLLLCLFNNMDLFWYRIITSYSLPNKFWCIRYSNADGQINYKLIIKKWWKLERIGFGMNYFKRDVLMTPRGVNEAILSKWSKHLDGLVWDKVDKRRVDLSFEIKRVTCLPKN